MKHRIFTMSFASVYPLEDPLMRHIRYLDKLVDELVKGRPTEKILRP